MRLLRNERGDVVQFVLVLAAIAVILVFVFNRVKFQSAVTVKETRGHVDMAFAEPDEIDAVRDRVGGGDGGADHDEGKYLIGKEVDDFIGSVQIGVGPDDPPYIYHYNDMLELKGTPIPKSEYTVAYPLKCTWTGIPDYEGDSCTPPTARFPVGTHEVTLRLCDQNGACANGKRNITVGYKDPIQSIAEDFENYRIDFWGNTSGEWRFDPDTMTIYSTKNVGWTGFVNPIDVDLQDYRFQFDMGVVPGDSDDDVIGFSFRHQDDNNMYVLTMDNRDSNGGVGGYHSGLYKIQNGVKTRLVDLTPMKWTSGVYMNVDIEAIGNQIVIHIDGNKVVDVINSQNPSKTGHTVRFTISQRNGRFKDLTIDIYK